MLNNNRHLLLLLALFTFTSHAQAGGRIGNGGDILVCPSANSHLLDIYLLDLLEHSNTYTPTPDIVSYNEWTWASTILDRLSTLDPMRANLYRTRLGEFRVQSELVAEYLEDITDSGTIANLPPSCSMEQAAIRVHTPNEPAHYYISLYWHSMSHYQRAALVLHEIVYGEAFDAGQRTSQNSREFVAFLFSKDFVKISPTNYRQLVTRLGL